MAITLTDKPLPQTAIAIINLAEQHGVTYRPTATDAWAQDVTRLADDEVALVPPTAVRHLEAAFRAEIAVP